MTTRRSRRQWVVPTRAIQHAASSAARILENTVTVATPVKRLSFAIPVRPSAADPVPEPTFVQIASPLPMASLDRAMAVLDDDHAKHVAGPVFPCPECFLPPLTQGR